MKFKDFFNQENLKLGLRFTTIILLSSLVITFIFFEIGTRVLTCPPLDLSVRPTCYETIPEEISPDAIAKLEQLREKDSNKEKIPKEEYIKTFEPLLIKVSREEMPNIDGISCGDYGYIRDDLPYQARLFVTRHEGEHMLQQNQDLEGKNKEFISTSTAWRNYPLGGLQAMLFSFRNHDWEKNQGITTCSFMNSWTTFKNYYLP